MILARAAATHTDVVCTLLFLGWVIAGVLALISLLRPIVNTVSALIVAVVLLVIWAVVC